MNRFARCGIVGGCLCFAAGLPTAWAQFKETPPAPYAQTTARQKIRTLLQNAGPDNQAKTVETLSGLVVWYRDLLDDELITAWKGNQRANLPDLVTSLADARLASAIVDYSWHEARPATFTLAYAPMLGNLMARYPASAEPFLRDLAGPAAAGGPMPGLSKPEADAVCRILLDMPDTGNWKKTALQILPYYRQSAQDLLVADLRGTDQDKSYRAQFWAVQLKLNIPGYSSDEPPTRRKLSRSLPPPADPPAGYAPPAGPAVSGSFQQRPHIVGESSLAPAPASPGNAQANAVSNRPYPFPAAPYPFPYTGPRSGTLKCEGEPIPPDGEYVFPGMPMGNLQLDLGGKPWEARLAPGQGQTQTLILTNKSSKPQKKCTVKWNLAP